MHLSLIVAAAKNGVIGVEGGLPWRLSSDLRRFKQLTMGHHLIMGRKTFESIGRLLPGRTTVVLTRSEDFDARGAVTAGSLDAALRACAGDDEAFVVGGAEVYRMALPRVDRIHLTEVEAQIEGDTYFPTFDRAAWRIVQQQHQPAGERDEYSSTYLVLDRLNSAQPAQAAEKLQHDAR
jgi:dihydrofolate reductase